ncbi:MAG: mannose-1-phosphate guanylyltransferase [Chthoniobacterales bacterium]
MMPNDVFVFIMAGGSGERFWPMSRIKRPKHLLRLLTDRSLLAETASRLEGICPEENIYVLTNATQHKACCEALENFPPERILTEPAKRDTGPAAALATALARTRGTSHDSICILLPADATIHDIAALKKNLLDAIELARESSSLITLGIKPNFASTGFGYLHLEDKEQLLTNGSRAYKVRSFVEKPDADTADDYLASGEYVWNAGMFLWRSSVFMKACRESAPDLANFIDEFPKENPEAYIAERFPTLEKLSVDYAVMERAREVRCVLADFDWDDVGTWTALPTHLPQDGQSNTLRGQTAVLDSHNNIAISNKRLIALCGVSDLIVVETEDAILVCHRNVAQDIKKLQSKIPEDLR